MLPKHCSTAYAFDSIHLKASDTLTPAADENDPAEQPVHTDELVAPAAQDVVSVTDAINRKGNPSDEAHGRGKG